MNQQQLNRYRIISNLIKGNITICEAAESLSLSERQIYRLKKGVEQEGVSFLIHKNTNKKPSHTFDDDLKQKIVNLKKSSRYKEANFKHFQELLLEHEGISISYSALHTLLSLNSITSPKKSVNINNIIGEKRKPKKVC